jgi:5-methylcytosine-specific restriction endonuclease McrA
MSAIPSKVRNEVAGRSGGWCEVKAKGCRNHGMHMHHILMRSQGGKHEASNLLHVCHQCHLNIHHYPALSYEMGWLKRSGIQQ